MAGKYVISKRSNGEFQFVLKAGNGRTILTSEGYKAKSSCKDGIGSVRVNSQVDARYERKTASNGSPYFLLKAGNGEPIGTSEMYSSESARDEGIASVKENGPTQEVDDTTD